MALFTTIGSQKCSNRFDWCITGTYFDACWMWKRRKIWWWRIPYNGRVIQIDCNRASCGTWMGDWINPTYWILDSQASHQTDKGSNWSPIRIHSWNSGLQLFLRSQQIRSPHYSNWWSDTESSPAMALIAFILRVSLSSINWTRSEMLHVQHHATRSKRTPHEKRSINTGLQLQQVCSPQSKEEANRTTESFPVRNLLDPIYMVIFGPLRKATLQEQFVLIIWHTSVSTNHEQC